MGTVVKNFRLEKSYPETVSGRRGWAQKEPSPEMVWAGLSIYPIGDRALQALLAMEDRRTIWRDAARLLRHGGRGLPHSFAMPEPGEAMTLALVFCLPFASRGYFFHGSPVAFFLSHAR